VRAACVVASILFGALTPAAGSAQSVFVQGAYGPDVRRFSGDDTERVFDASVPAVTIGGGGFVRPHVSLSLEADFGGTSTEARTVTLTLAGRPATITTTYGLQRRSIAALAGVHTNRDGRVHVAGYAGLAFSAVRQEVVSDAPPIVLSNPQPPTIFSGRTAEPIVGADVIVAVAGPLAVSGGVRAQGLALGGTLRGFSVRPRVGLRVSF
jgi:hypothetical protein